MDDIFQVWMKLFGEEDVTTAYTILEMDS